MKRRHCLSWRPDHRTRATWRARWLQVALAAWLPWTAAMAAPLPAGALEQRSDKGQDLLPAHEMPVHVVAADRV